MPPKRQGRWARTKLAVATRVAPIGKPDIAFLDSLEIELAEAKVNLVGIPPMPPPLISPDCCPEQPQNQALDVLGDTPAYVEDLTPWLAEQLERPDIESIPLLTRTRQSGRVYREDIAEPKPLSVSEMMQAEGDNRCKHGLLKRACGICRDDLAQRIRTAEREKATPQVHPFDMILPLLQPPLGEDFDSPIACASLYPFQVQGVKWLLEHERGLLADEMGLGKSIQAITALQVLFRTGNIENALILCPTSVVTDWEKKLWDWAPELRVWKIRGLKPQRAAFWQAPAHVYLTNYESLRQDLAGSLGSGDGSAGDTARTRFDVVIMDEIQKIKNPSADVTKATRLVESPIRWGLSGTPLENRVEDLVSVFACLKPGLLREDDARRPPYVKKQIEPYLLRRRAEIIPDFPKVSRAEKWLELSPAQREAYERADNERVVELNELGDSVTVQHVLAWIGALKQICNVERVSGESCKLDALQEDLIELTERGDKALVFSQYPEKTLRLLEPKLREFNPTVFSGTLSDAQRKQIVEEFQRTDEHQVLLMSVKAGGIGLTLHRANHVFHFDLWWNPAVSIQAEGRVRRIGQQEKTVFVTSYLTVDTIEERIDKILKRKRQLFEEVIDDLSDTNLPAALTEDELFSLFGLRKGGGRVPRPHDSPVPDAALKADHRRGTARDFEHVVAELYEQMGYGTRVTQQSRDQGIDVYAKRTTAAGTEEIAVQCKHYSGTVGVDEARALLGIVEAHQNLSKGVLVTSGRFSKDCVDFARERARIQLIDRSELLGLLTRYGLSLPADPAAS